MAEEIFEVTGVADGLAPRQARRRRQRSDGSEVGFTAIARLDTQVEIEYYQNGGILPAVLRQLMN